MEVNRAKFKEVNFVTIRGEKFNVFTAFDQNFDFNVVELHYDEIII
jgi:hypothetical protein